MSRPFVPDRRDLVWLSFSPQAGREQAGRRPALILSPATYNARSGLAVACPITRRIKGYPFEVRVEVAGIRGVILTDHLRSIDWRARDATLIEPAAASTFAAVLAKLRPLLGL